MELTNTKTILSEENLRSWIIRKARAVYVPSAVYRVQLNSQFTFNHLKAVLPYLKGLGIEAVYCSPYFQAVPGSTHGYDVTNPNKINPEIGTEEDYARFCEALREHGLGQIVDVVSNHMGISGNDNIWWHDVLENGQSSFYADHFDIEWESAKSELNGKVLLPILGGFYGRVLENQEIRLAFDNGAFKVTYYDRHFPLDPQTYPAVLEHGIDTLKKRLGAEDRDFLEYLSIITAFRNLPSTTETDRGRVLERHREKEIAKERLAALAAYSNAVREFIESRVILFNGKRGEPKSFDLLDDLLNRQSYRMGLWSVAAQEINYRRFFNINDLAAIRVEDPVVFRHYHEFLFKLVREGRISGLRIDHPDGLYDPPAYFKAIQRECLLQFILAEREKDPRDGEGGDSTIDLEAARASLDRLFEYEFLASPVLYVVVEKILDRNEEIPNDWNVHGTVGYDFMNAVNGLFVDQRHEEDLDLLYKDYIGRAIDFEDLVYSKKKFFGLVHMASEINALGYRLDHISETNRKFRDFTRNDLILAIREVIACFPVYRTYISPQDSSPSDKAARYITAAVERAKKRTPALNPAVYNFLRDVLLLRMGPEIGEEEARLYRDFILRFQQLTGPIMAKGMEDTSFYVYNRLISLNEVGGDPFYFGYSPDDLHAFNLARNKRWPCAFLAATTHDTKRSEDARMRVNVLSEIPREWRAVVDEWSALNFTQKVMVENRPMPDPNTEYYIYQTLIGVWPDASLSADEFPAFIERLWMAILKAIREAKAHTSWASPDQDYENAVHMFLERILSPGDDNAFIKAFLPFQKKIAFYGKLNALSATAIRIGSPGVVDVYQGDELWNYCLVDPDNRRAVDFQRRRECLDAIKAGGLENMENAKALLFWKGLNLRRSLKDVFVGGKYIPLTVRGGKPDNMFAFLRRRGGRTALVAAARLFTEITDPSRGFAPDPDFWKDTEIVLPADAAHPEAFEDVFSGEKVFVKKIGKEVVISAAEVFRKMYVCLASCYARDDRDPVM